MSFLPPLPPTFEAALRDVKARSVDARVAAAERLGRPEPGGGARALHALRELAGDRDARVRAAAVRALPELGDAEALTPLFDRMEDKDALVRELAVVGVATVGGERAVLALLEALGSTHPEVRFQAVACYVETSSQPELAPVLALLEDPDPKVRGHAARSLARVGPSAREALREALQDELAGVRREAAIALARLGDDAGKLELVEALDDAELRVDALDAIGDLHLEGLADVLAPLALSRLRPWPVKVAAARALARLGDPRGVRGLEHVLSAFRSGGRNYAVQIVGELQLRELAPLLARLARRLRGTVPETLAEALTALLPTPDAVLGLTELAGGDGEAARKAQEALRGHV